MKIPLITLDQSQTFTNTTPQETMQKASFEGRSVVPCPSKRCFTDIRIKKIVLVALAVISTLIGPTILVGTVGAALPVFDLIGISVLSGIFGATLGGLSAASQWPRVDYQTPKATDKSQCVDIKAIIFDCDGTLIDNGIESFLKWQYALKCQGYELNADEFWDFMNKNALVGASGVDDVIIKYCCELLGRECANEIQEAKKAFSAKVLKSYEFPAIEPTVKFYAPLEKKKKFLVLNWVWLHQIQKKIFSEF